MYFREIEKLEIMVKHESIRNKKLVWHHYYDRYPKFNGVLVYKVISRFLDYNTGESYDMAFHYLCKHYPKEFQEYFHRDFYGRHPYYKVDEDGNIVDMRYRFNFWKQRKNKKSNPKEYLRRHYETLDAIKKIARESAKRNRNKVYIFKTKQELQERFDNLPT